MDQNIIKKIERCETFFENIYDKNVAKAIINRATEFFENEKEKMPTIKSKGNLSFMAFMNFMIFIYKALKEKESKEKALKICTDCLNFSIDLDFEASEEIRNSYNDHERVRASRKRLISDVNEADEEFGWIYEDAKYPDPDKKILYSFNVTRCGMYTLCKLFGVEELMPSICQGDFYMVKYFPDRCVFHRESTLADGADYCDFLYTYE